jgi:hypothetical protein
MISAKRIIYLSLFLLHFSYHETALKYLFTNECLSIW